MSLALLIPGVGMGGGVGITWTDRGRLVNHVAANWIGSRHYLEAYFRAISGTAYARLYDNVAAEAVANSQLSSVSAVLERVRSNALTLTDGHDYITQSGTIPSDSGGMKGSALISLSP